MVEFLVAIALIFGLLAILFPALELIRRKATIATANRTVAQVTTALTLYRATIGHGQFPPCQVDGHLTAQGTALGSKAVLVMLERSGLYDVRPERVDVHHRLIDPWKRPFRYALSRPVVSDPESLKSWNFNLRTGRERSWREYYDMESGTIKETVSPFPYVYSLGASGSDQIGSHWIYVRDAK